MTLNELKKKVAESNNLTWFQNVKLNLNYSHINYSVSLEGIVAIYDFILKQVKGFDAIVNLPQELQNTRTYFDKVKNTIIAFVANDNPNDHSWSNTITQISSPHAIIFPSDAPETEFLIRIALENVNYYQGAYEFLSGNPLYPNDKYRLTGYLLAYEFITKDSSELVKRKDLEKKSVSKIRNELQQQLANSESDLTNYLAEANRKVADYYTSLEEFKLNKEKGYTNWFDDISNEFESFRKVTAEKIEALENLYKEKLKLEAPAKYWNTRAQRLRKEGYWWLGGLGACVAITVFILVWVLSKISDGSIEKVFQNTATAIKWSIALITLVSFLAFAIRTLSKLTFSSFHLVRDAEEREQLTYVYLALQKEKGIDETERHLIMQSLFSRADSGLLKDDASPTMPGNIMDKMMSK